jgi:hypothetical protein
MHLALRKLANFASDGLTAATAKSVIFWDVRVFSPVDVDVSEKHTANKKQAEGAASGKHGSGIGLGTSTGGTKRCKEISENADSAFFRNTGESGNSGDTKEGGGE